jgi:hypothetical protein
VSSSLIFPSLTSCKTIAAENDFVVLPISKRELASIGFFSSIVLGAALLQQRQNS